MTNIRLAVIGAGHLGKIHTRLAQQLQGVEFVGIVEPHDETRCALAAEHEMLACAHHDDLLDRIDAAVIADLGQKPVPLGVECAGLDPVAAVHLFLDLAGELDDAVELAHATGPSLAASAAGRDGGVAATWLHADTISPISAETSSSICSSFCRLASMSRRAMYS